MSEVARPRVVLVTRAAFLCPGIGWFARVRSLVRWLADRVDLTVVRIGPTSQAEVVWSASSAGPWRLHWIGRERAPAASECARALAELLGRECFDACILDRIELAPLRAVVPAATRVLLDTHDLVSQQAPSIAARGGPVAPAPTLEQELEIFEGFDDVIMIQGVELDLVRPRLGTRALLVPHPAIVCPRTLRPVAAVVGFVASGWFPNVEGATWFLERVWPRVHRPGLSFEVYGWVADRLPIRRAEGLVLRGFQPDLRAIYDRIDVVINPVRCGSGLKIKTVEGLEAGLPMVSTSEGARGLEALVGRGLLVADDEHAFADRLGSLLADEGRRRALAAAAVAWLESELGPGACYGELLARLSTKVSRAALA